MDLAGVKKVLPSITHPKTVLNIFNFSGGQKRRVSFAVALLHNPELLILDEPTVGVDPILRQSIWLHLIQLSSEQNKTILITTHYIEEARQANVVSFMRNGKLLAEDSPSNLLEIYRLETLEQVFLKLCRRDEKVITTNPEREISNKSLVLPSWTSEFRICFKRFENLTTSQ
jgi:ABC-type multidrug transport system ATPase subunit